MHLPEADADDAQKGIFLSTMWHWTLANCGQLSTVYAASKGLLVSQADTFPCFQNAFLVAGCCSVVK